MAIVPYQPGGQAAGALNARVPTGVPTDPASESIVARMLTDLADTRIALEPSVAVYRALPSDPTWTVVCDRRAVASYRAPDGVRPGVPIDEDGPVIVYDPAAAPTSELRLWRAQPDPAGRRLVCQGWGLFDSSGCGSGLPLYGWGTGSGLSSGAGLLRGWEVGELLTHNAPIAHALRLHAPAWCSSSWRAPATRSDQGGDGPLVMGMRLRLEVTDQQIQARTVPGDDPDLTRLLRAICLCLRDYGAVILDGVAGRQWTIPVEHGITAPEIERLRLKAPNGYLGNVIRDQHATGDGLKRRPSDGVPWDRLRVLARGTW